MRENKKYQAIMQLWKVYTRDISSKVGYSLHLTKKDWQNFLTNSAEKNSNLVSCQEYAIKPFNRPFDIVISKEEFKELERKKSILETNKYFNILLCQNNQCARPS